MGALSARLQQFKLKMCPPLEISCQIVINDHKYIYKILIEEKKHCIFKYYIFKIYRLTIFITEKINH